MVFDLQVRRLLEEVEGREPQQSYHYLSLLDEGRHLAFQTTWNFGHNIKRLYQNIMKSK